MFDFCADPALLDTLPWMACYLTTAKQVMFYQSFLVVIALLAVTAPIALAVGFCGALARRSHLAPLRWIGVGYTSIVRGVPDIAFFLFVPLALDQGLEYLRHKVKCPDWDMPIRQGNDFVVCAAAKLPQSGAAPLVHDLYAIALAIAAYAFVFGAFAAFVLSGAMNAVPKAQLETAEAYGLSRRQITWRILVPQMWVYALPGLSNLWMVLIKATPLLFLLGITDIVYWARELGGMKTTAYAYPHGDWRLWYFMALLVFYLGMTKLSEIAFERLGQRLSRGQATLAGMTQAKS
ncbi:ABC transporter permease subunit [Pseudooceanicola sediminis]|uniref:ABC transporter permease subunit n=1 Tax=Pseudooceanicola sediminis TaxID=2211117 RepID=A0A399IXB1_9RHOB|nr:ABC transporter permease subunit [Pseudooceanicola sediminis]KAA2313181.1 ABC transporter permease subunit [Puniceibacterium sp. HSS470]RII37828.1 ABC transporter permease subunit [Pseudooceanicola sediminis]|tara:strand:- start:41406 stop:42281 length:876 start_codon:yes stop_codon:yes gene_type:complete